MTGEAAETPSRPLEEISVQPEVLQGFLDAYRDDFIRNRRLWASGGAGSEDSAVVEARLGLWEHTVFPGLGLLPQMYAIREEEQKKINDEKSS